MRSRSTRLVFLTLFLFVACADDSSTATSDQGPLDLPPTDSTSTADGALADQGSATDSAPDRGGGVVIPSTWITVQPGTFTMGSSATENCRLADEKAHVVTLTRSFAISEKEVTQEQFLSLMGYSPAFNEGCGPQCPVEWVSWHEAVAYCTALSRAEKVAECFSCQGQGDAVACQPASSFIGAGQSIYDCGGYRLPTEAEWEYAARAGSTTPLYNGSIQSCMTADNNANTIGWYKVNSTGSSHPVGEKAANDWGLYDMAGNVYEWVFDWYKADLEDATDPSGATGGTARVFRGGAWYFNAEHLRSAHRLSFRPEKRFTFLGFRCARTL